MKIDLFELVSQLFMPIVGFIAGFFWSRFIEWIRFVRARARYIYGRHVFPEREDVILIDTAIPNFILDGQSLVATDEEFILSVPDDLGFDKVNEQLRGDRHSQRFRIGPHSIFGSTELGSLDEITKIPNLCQRIEVARREVAFEFLEKSKGKFFNSQKVGLRNFYYDRVGDDERSRLDLRIYYTDYYTHTVMQRVVSKYILESKYFIPLVEKNTDLINKRFYPFTTSIGLNVFLFSDLKRRIIFGKRSHSVSDDNRGAGLLHVAMNEGFSQTDYDHQRRGDGHITVLNCFRRGLREELGIGEYDRRIGEIYVYDLFLVKQSFQIGLFAWATFHGYATDLLNLRAQDKQLEAPDLVSASFSDDGLKELLKHHQMIPYTRVGLENLCKIHGLKTTDFDSANFYYYKCLASSAYRSLFSPKGLEKT